MITSTMELISKESKAGTAFSVLSLTRLIEKAAILKERDEDICYHSLTPPYIEGQLPGTDTQDGSCLLSGLFFDWAAKATTTATRTAKKAKGSDWQNNNYARALHFFVHFFVLIAPLRREKT